jgi:hypothetical protein
MNRKKIIIYIISFGALFSLLIFLISANLIGDSVKSHCEIVQKEYKGDCVEALMKSIEDDKIDYGEKNSSIWALGQLGDKRSLPFLKKYYIGNSKIRTKWNEALSQYELYKAIKLLDGGFNATAFIWR